MSVRKRKWTTAKGEVKEAWISDFVDQNGVRQIKTFTKKKDADAHQATVKVDISTGVHIASKLTVAEAGKQWLEHARAGVGREAALERATVRNYEDMLNRHIVPFIGKVPLASINPSVVQAFERQLLEAKRSRVTIKGALACLGSILADAGAPRNAVRDRPRFKKSGRSKQKLEVGVDIPTPDEARAIINGASGRWRPILITAIFTGLRASELRGLAWKDVDFGAGLIRVTQRADRYYEIGSPKTKSSQRVVPMPKFVANTLKEWKLRCPKGELGLVFPNGRGKVEDLANIINRALKPAQVFSGIVDEKGEAKYTGMHCLRHYYASWCINRTKDGGLGLPPKIVQSRLGHSTLAMTMDVYGHLFQGDDSEEMDKAIDALMAAS
jgi:integrase